MFKEKRAGFIALFLILALGVGLRIVNLDKFDFWFDEASAVLQARNIETIDFTQDNNPPLYVYALHLWGKYFDSEYGLRLLSVLFGSMAIIMVFVLGRLLYETKIALISAFILAVSPFHIYYSREARRYSMSFLLSLLAVYFFIKSFQKGRMRFWAGFIIFTVLSIYCHYVNVLNWMFLVVFFLMAQKTLNKEIKIKGWISNFLILVSFAPWFLIIFARLEGVERVLSDYGKAFWGQSPSFRALFMTFKNFSAGYNASMAACLASVIIFFFFFNRGIFALREKKKKELVLSLLCLSGPIFTACIISLHKPFYIDRFFISSSVFYYFIIAGGLSGLGNKKLVFSLLLLSGLSFFSLKNYYGNVFPPLREAYAWEQRRQDHKAIAEYINERFEKGDGVFHSCQNTIASFVYYSDKLKNIKGQSRDKNILLTFNGKFNGLKFLEFNKCGKATGETYMKPSVDEKKFWLISSGWHFRKTDMRELESPGLLKWLNKNYRVIEKKELDNAIIFLYSKI